MKKIDVFCLLIFTIFNCKAQNLSTENSNELVGEYYLINLNNNEKYFNFEIKLDSNEIYHFINEKESFPIKKINRDKLENEFYKNLPDSTIIIGNLDKDLLLIIVNKDWEYNGFKSETGYFLITVIGPVQVYKN